MARTNEELQQLGSCELNADLISILEAQEEEDNSDDNHNPLSMINLKCEYIDVDTKREKLNNKQLLCMHLNIRSLPGKHDSLKMMLSTLDENGFKPDIILLCETWLNDHNYNTFNLENYDFVETHRRKSKGGGVGIYINQEINYKIREDLSLFEEGAFESIFIETLGNDMKTIIGEIYRVPNTNESIFLDKYSDILNKIGDNNEEIIIGTDQNLDLLRFEQHTRTKEFLDINFSYGLIPTITKPTRVTHASATLIDNIYISSKKVHSINSQILITDISDHFPVLVSVGPKPPKNRTKVKITKRSLDSVAIENLQNILKMTYCGS